MIKANELRLDNWVFELGVDYIHEHPVPDHEDKTPVMVDLIVMNNIINHDGTTRMPCYDPIPITPEILEKAGFVRESGAYIIQLDDSGNHLSFVKNDNGFVCLSHMLNNVLKYLHQLQNLYFALCGSELNINL